MTGARFDLSCVSGKNPSCCLTLETEKGKVIVWLHITVTEIENVLGPVIRLEGGPETAFIQLGENIIPLAKPIA